MARSIAKHKPLGAVLVALTVLFVGASSSAESLRIAYTSIAMVYGPVADQRGRVIQEI